MNPPHADSTSHKTAVLLRERGPYPVCANGGNTLVPCSNSESQVQPSGSRLVVEYNATLSSPENPGDAAGLRIVLPSSCVGDTQHALQQLRTILYPHSQDIEGTKVRPRRAASTFLAVLGAPVIAEMIVHTIPGVSPLVDAYVLVHSVFRFKI